MAIKIGTKKHVKSKYANGTIELIPFESKPLTNVQRSCIAWAMNNLLNVGIYSETNVQKLSESQQLRALRAILDTTDGTAFTKAFIRKTIRAIEGGAQ